jgi:hypothetical protein
MKKLSVNGKTFDEVFAERGEAIIPLNLKECEIYLQICDKSGYISIRHIYKIVFSEAYTDFFISSSGYYGSICGDTRYHDLDENYNKFYEATQNQIELLNLYKNEKL